MPSINNNIPTTILKYFKTLPDLLTRDIASSVKNPTNKNGMPRPIAYDNNNMNADPGCETARANTLPSIAPTHGLHPTANAAPNTNDVIYLELNFLTSIL